MNDFRFADPQWGHGLWGVAVLTALLVLFEIRSNRSIDRFMGGILQGRLVSQASRSRRLVRAGCVGLSALFLVIALMRPQFGLAYVSTPKVGAEIMIALDVSRSMLATDVVPNRLERSKQEIADLLPLLEGDQVGLIAFAGRASILCPLTPDFSFLRLVLDEVEANSVGRGGTRLEEPIRKAIAAFGDEGDAARAILLISDGEDHDSFPLEACDLAMERGIQVIAIGIGDEGGVPIEAKNPKTGAVEPIYGSDGARVITRLDGETLRDMALRTDGIYIPAGTSAMDLEEIHRTAIAPLMRSKIESGGRTVRQEAYQWPALLALISLLCAGLAAGSGRTSRLLTLTALCLAFLPVDLANAQAPSPEPASAEDTSAEDNQEESIDPPGSETDGAEAGGEAESGDGAEERPATPDEPADPDADLTPRELHNRALEDLANGDLDAAKRRFERTEKKSGLDVTLRYQCRYHLGWVEVKQADTQLEAAPESALESLETAADRFRDAIRVKPTAAEARHNLEVVLRRIREIRDSLRQKEERDLAQRLDELITRQRELLGEARSLIERDTADPNSALEEPRRREYRAVASSELQILSDLEGLARDADEERRSIEGKPEEERTPEELVRTAQLEAMLTHLTRAQERIGQARRTLRRQQGERAARRASLGLSALKRSREQLRDPLQVLDGILPDARALAQQAYQWLAGTMPSIGNEAPPPPPWITAASLGEESEEIAGRVGELAARFRAAAEADHPPPAEGDPEAQAQARLLENVRAALPHLDRGSASFEQARTAYGEEKALPAFEAIGEGLSALNDAVELFLDAKRLIEKIWQDENIAIAYLRGDDGAEPLARLERLPQIAELHGKNLDRLVRLRDFIEEEGAQVAAARAQAEAPTDPNAPTPPTTEELDGMEQRMEIVFQLLAEVEVAAGTGRDWFDAQDLSTPDAIDLEAGVAEVAAILPPLENLRRFYFTIVEHLNDVTRRQIELNDQTADAVALAQGVPAETPQHLLPLAPEQQELQALSAQLAPAIAEQGEQMAQSMTAQGTSASPEADEQRQAWQRASELVEAAAGELTKAIESIFTARPDGTPYALEEGTAAQRAALEQLIEALSLLEPPQPESEPGDDSEQDQSQNESGESQQDPNREAVDPAQLLQEVRDREAKRRADKQRGGRSDPTVEKDW